MAFLQGICDFHRFSGWFFVVRLWWIDGGNVVFMCMILGVKIFRGFEIYFLVDGRKAKATTKAKQ
jgi:hypothetical protein